MKFVIAEVVEQGSQFDDFEIDLRAAVDFVLRNPFGRLPDAVNVSPIVAAALAGHQCLNVRCSRFD